MAFKVGDAVKMKQGVKDSESGIFDMSGWQGWITEVPTKREPNYELVWDTETLKNMPNEYIVKGNQEEADWVCYFTNDAELEKATPRDTFKAAKAFAADWEDKHAFNDGSADGAIIMKVIGDEQDVVKNLEKWQRYLTETLAFPFEATVTDSDNKAVKEGSVVTVTGLGNKKADEENGLMAKIKIRGMGMQHPLCDLEGMEDAPNTVHVNAYAGWFICQQGEEE